MTALDRWRELDEREPLLSRNQIADMVGLDRNDPGMLGGPEDLHAEELDVALHWPRPRACYDRGRVRL